jgi:hypothetical protein
VFSVNRYEHDRPYKRCQIEMVLSREEREEVLREWSIPQDDVIQATRDNLKAKFQRRQTVRNVRRVEKLEIAFEGAAKSLKRALHLRKRTSEEVDDMQERANLAAQALDAARSAAHHDFEEPVIDDGVVGTGELEDYDDAWNKISEDAWNKMDVADSSYTRESMGDADGRMPYTLDDAASAMSGITFDSTTSSVTEMERFHRELELEMFGSGPSIPQTLELPETKSEHTSDTCSATADASSSTSMPSFTSFRNNEVGRRFHPMERGVSPPMQQPIHQQGMHTPNYQGGNTPNYQGGNTPNYHGGNTPNYQGGNAPNYQGRSLVHAPNQHMQYNPYVRTSAYRGYSLRDAYRGNQVSAFDTAGSRLPASRNYSGSGDRGYEERHVSMDSQINPLGSPSNVLYEREERNQHKSSTIQDHSDGPTIKHLPYSTLSTFHDHEPVTISEDQIYDDPRPELLDLPTRSAERGYEERQVAMERQINPLGSPPNVVFEREERNQYKSSTIQDDSNDGPIIKNLPYSTLSTFHDHDHEPVTVSEDRIHDHPRTERVGPGSVSTQHC